MSRRTETLVILGVCAVFAVAAGEFISYYPPAGQLKTAHTGMYLPDPIGYEWKSSLRTLVLGLLVGCPHCEHDMPFYQELRNLEESQRLQAHILALFPDPMPKAVGELQNSLFGVDLLANVDFGRLGISGTPTLLLVDNRGKIRARWFGELSDEGKHEIMDAVLIKAKCAEDDQRPCG